MIIILFGVATITFAQIASCESKSTFFNTHEQHDAQVPLIPTENIKIHGKLNVVQSESESRRLIYEYEADPPVEIRNQNSSWYDKYKPWGAASLPTSNSYSPEVILDDVDEELFAPNSERHSYDEKLHQDIRIRL